jgi:nucleoid-associated protein YgaU
VKATVAQRSDSWPASTEESPAGSAVLLRPATRRRGSARGAATRAPRPPLRLVATDGRVVRPASGEPVRTNQAAPLAPSQPAAAQGPAATRPAAPAAARSAAQSPAHTPVRLTRRGRLVVTGMAVLLVAAGSVALAGAAQAIGHSGAQARPGTAGAAGAAITKVEVRPGQSLWTLAEAYDPNADTRQVIQEILQLNSLSTDQVQPGQVLWMPRD